jgi:hypothetical protein
MSLTTLIPDPADFLTRWPDVPGAYRGQVAADDSVFPLHALGAYVDTGCLLPDHVVVLRDGAITDRGLYVRDGRVVPGALRGLIDDGFTLSLRNMQDFVPSLARMCRAIRQESGYPCHASAYLTPAGTKGLGPHWDPYTVVVAQIAGAKTWPLYRPVVTHPTPEHLKFSVTGFTEEQRRHVTEDPPDLLVTLGAGDTLVVPRGWIHRPFTEGGEASLHVTFGVREVTRYWLAQQIVHEALARDEFRVALHPHGLTRDLTAEVGTVRAVLADFLADLDQAALASSAQDAAAGLSLTP